jgi:hypothetical protein
VFDLREARQKRAIADRDEPRCKTLAGNLPAELGPDAGGFAGGERNDGPRGYRSSRRSST